MGAIRGTGSHDCGVSLPRIFSPALLVQGEAVDGKCIHSFVCNYLPCASVIVAPTTAERECVYMRTSK